MLPSRSLHSLPKPWFISVRHIPEWLPWISYKPLARWGHDIGVEAVKEPMDFVKEAMVNATTEAPGKTYKAPFSPTGLRSLLWPSMCCKRRRNSIKQRKKRQRKLSVELLGRCMRVSNPTMSFVRLKIASCSRYRHRTWWTTYPDSASFTLSC